MRSPRNSGANHAPGVEARELGARSDRRPARCPSVVRSSVSSWITTSSPSAESWQSSSIASAPSVERRGERRVRVLGRASRRAAMGDAEEAHGGSSVARFAGRVRARGIARATVRWRRARTATRARAPTARARTKRCAEPPRTARPLARGRDPRADRRRRQGRRAPDRSRLAGRDHRRPRARPRRAATHPRDRARLLSEPRAGARPARRPRGADARARRRRPPRDASAGASSTRSLWEMDWRVHFQPVRAGRSLVVVPPWDRGAHGGRRRVVIHPGMAFGTGQHATTLGCLEALETPRDTAAGARARRRHRHRRARDRARQARRPEGARRSTSIRRRSPPRAATSGGTRSAGACSLACRSLEEAVPVERGTRLSPGRRQPLRRRAGRAGAGARPPRRRRRSPRDVGRAAEPAGAASAPPTRAPALAPAFRRSGAAPG